METNINTELFKRYAPQKKLEIIKQLTPDELMNVNIATFTKIAKEAGEAMWKSRNKSLHIKRERQRGNSWNSTVDALVLYKSRLYLDVYVQYESTDTSTYYPLSQFLKSGESRIEILRDDRYGNPRTYYAHYDDGSKLRVIRSILEEYVYTKYHDKIKEEAA